MISNIRLLKQFHDTIGGMGEKAVAAEFMFEIEGWEHLALITNQCPWPMLSTGGEIEVPGPIGMMSWQPQQLKYANSGPISLQETSSGAAEFGLMEILNGNRGKFDAKVYEGSTREYRRYKRLRDCFIVVDQIDRDWESRSEVLRIAGTLHFHYFGEIIAGNIA